MVKIEMVEIEMVEIEMVTLQTAVSNTDNTHALPHSYPITYENNDNTPSKKILRPGGSSISTARCHNNNQHILLFHYRMYTMIIAPLPCTCTLT